MIVHPREHNSTPVPSDQGSSAFGRAFRYTLSLADRRPGLSILLFHRVLTIADPYRPDDLTAAQFDAVVAALAKTFVVLPLEEGIERLTKNSLPRAALSITFDDGYQDNLNVAAPILLAHGVAATFFIATGFLDGGWMWNDQIIEACKRTSRSSICLPAFAHEMMELGAEHSRVATAHAIIANAKYLPLDQRDALVAQLKEGLDVRLGRGPMLDPEGLRRLSGLGMSIGAHTVAHPILAQIDDTKARVEINESRAHLLAVLREPVRTFAYPNGRPGRDYRPEHVRMVAKAGFDAAVSTIPATARPNMGQYEFPRFTPWDKAPWRFAMRLALNRMSTGSPLPSE